MFNQSNRRACLEAIKSCYQGKAELLADRRSHKCYWSIWSYDQRRLLEVIKEQDKISIYEFICNS